MKNIQSHPQNTLSLLFKSTDRCRDYINSKDSVARVTQFSVITNNEELLKLGLCVVSSYLRAWQTRNELAKNTQTVKKIHAVT